MQVRTGDASRLADGTENITPAQYIARFDIDPAQMCVQADQALAMIDIDHIAAEKEITRLDNGAIGGDTDICTFGCRNIEATVRVALLLVKKSAQSKDAADFTADRPDEFDVLIIV